MRMVLSERIESASFNKTCQHIIDGNKKLKLKVEWLKAHIKDSVAKITIIK